MAITYEHFNAVTRRAELVGRLANVEAEHFRLTVDSSVETDSAKTPGGRVFTDSEGEDGRKARLAQLEKDHKALSKALSEVDAEVAAETPEQPSNG